MNKGSRGGKYQRAHPAVERLGRAVVVVRLADGTERVFEDAEVTVHAGVVSQAATDRSFTKLVLLLERP